MTPNPIPFSLRLHDRNAIPGVQLVGDLRVESESKGLAILRALDWLSARVKFGQ